MQGGPNGGEQATDLLSRLRARLVDYDGRSTSHLTAIRSDLAQLEGYTDALIHLVRSDEGHDANAATWLLKQDLEAGGKLGQAQVQALLDAIEGLSDWAAQLHILQSLRQLDLPESRAQALADWLKPLLVHKRPFLRAWALDALAHLARQHDGYDRDFGTALEKALDDDAASVRARARKLVSEAG